MATWRVIQFGGPRFVTPANTITVLWYVTSCDTLDRHKHFGRNRWSHFQCRRFWKPVT